MKAFAEPKAANNGNGRRFLNLCDWALRAAADSPAYGTSEAKWEQKFDLLQPPNNTLV